MENDSSKQIEKEQKPQKKRKSSFRTSPTNSYRHWVDIPLNEHDLGFISKFKRPKDENTDRPKRRGFRKLLARSFLFFLMVGALFFVGGAVKDTLRKPVMAFKADFRSWLEAQMMKEKFQLSKIQWVEIRATNLSPMVSELIRSGDLEKRIKLSAGENLWSLNLKGLEKKLLDTPWIQEVRLYKKLPNELVIHYSPHEIRALLMKRSEVGTSANTVPWVVSAVGKPIATAASLNEEWRQYGRRKFEKMNFPVLFDLEKTNGQTPEESESPRLGLQWLLETEKVLGSLLGSVHEVQVRGDSVRMVLDIKFGDAFTRVKVVSDLNPDAQALARLRKTVEYLIKNHIVVQALDLRQGKKVVVNIGNHS